MVDLTRLITPRESRGCRGRKGIHSIKGPGSQGSRVNGSQGLNSFKGTKNLRVSGFQGIEGLPILTGPSIRPGVSKVQRFQGPRDEGFFGLQAPRVKGIKGF